MSGFGVGRRFHNMYSELKFVSIKLENGKAAAICEICNRTMKNTAISRLQLHRKICKNPSDSEAEIDYSKGSRKYNTKKSRGSQIQYLPQPRCESVNIKTEPSQEIDIQKSELNEIWLQLGVPTDMVGMEVVDEDAFQENHGTTVLTSNNDERGADYGLYCHNDNSENSYVLENNVCENDPLRPSSQSSFQQLSAVSTTKKVSIPAIRNKEKALTDNIARTFKTKKEPSSFVDGISPYSKEKADLALAQYFFGCNIPFSVIESEHFKNFMKVINPSYNLPSRITISSTLLDRVYADVISLNCRSVGNLSCLIIDSWKNAANNTLNIVTMLQTAGGPTLFLESNDFSTEREAGEALSSICKQSLEIATSQYNCEVYAIVSDNTSHVTKMGCWHSTCSSHIANLLAKDVVDLNMMKEVNMVLLEFKRTELESLLIENGGGRVVLPADTRWCSYRDACQSFMQNLPIIKKICASHDIKIPGNVAFHLHDEYFHEKVYEIIHVLNPICELINKCQGSKFSVADATEEWINLKNVSTEDERIRLSIHHHFNIAVTVYGLAANFLHPIYNGKQLEANQMDLVLEFLLDILDSAGLDGLNAFTNKSDIFAKLLDKEVVSPDTFWGLAQRKFPSFGNLALKLLKIPASSAQLKRVSTSWSFVHSSMRNRLSSERLKRLIAVYYSLKLRDHNNSDEY